MYVIYDADHGSGHKQAPRRLALLVDPDVAVRESYAHHLQLVAFEVKHAADGRLALALALEIKPSVIVTEMRLPGMHGHQLVAILRMDHTTREIPIIVISDDAPASEMDCVRAAGADTVLSKPCPPEVLIAEVSRLLQFPAARSAAPGVSAFRRRARLQPDALLLPPPPLVCPLCDRPLAFAHSHLGGVGAQRGEQWDDYICESGCGATFEYRHRTRKLRRT